MANFWVWRHDGTLQCGQGSEQPLEEAHEQLAAIIGADSVLNGEKRQAPVILPTVCGAPTGQANAFELTESGYYLLFHGFVGPIGFRPWLDDKLAHVQAGLTSSILGVEEHSARKQLTLAGFGAGEPTSIQELFGRQCRAYTVGDALTMDFRPDRFNVGLVNGRIRELWFG
jgi:hypothetical protein